MDGKGFGVLAGKSGAEQGGDVDRLRNRIVARRTVARGRAVQRGLRAVIAELDGVEERPGAALRQREQLFVQAFAQRGGGSFLLLGGHLDGAGAVVVVRDVREAEAARRGGRVQAGFVQQRFGKRDGDRAADRVLRRSGGCGLAFRRVVRAASGGREQKGGAQKQRAGGFPVSNHGAMHPFRFSLAAAVRGTRAKARFFAAVLDIAYRISSKKSKSAEVNKKHVEIRINLCYNQSTISKKGLWDVRSNFRRHSRVAV